MRHGSRAAGFRADFEDVTLSDRCRGAIPLPCRVPRERPQRPPEVATGRYAEAEAQAGGISVGVDHHRVRGG